MTLICAFTRLTCSLPGALCADCNQTFPMLCSGVMALCQTVTRGGGKAASLCVAGTRPTAWNRAPCTPRARLRLPRWALWTRVENIGYYDGERRGRDLSKFIEEDRGDSRAWILLIYCGCVGHLQLTNKTWKHFILFTFGSQCCSFLPNEFDGFCQMDISNVPFVSLR